MSVDSKTRCLPDDGGPAFPIAPDRNANDVIHYGWNGMTLRDWFAGQVMAAMCGDMQLREICGNIAKDAGLPDGTGIVARLAYDQADAMISERGKCS